MTTTAVASGSGDGQPAIDENDLTIHKVQHLRMAYIEQLTPNGEMPADQETRGTIVQLLNGASNTAIASKRIKADQAVAANQAAQLNAILDGVAALRSGRSKAVIGNRPATVVDVEFKTVPGHTDMGTHPVDTDRILTDPNL